MLKPLQDAFDAKLQELYESRPTLCGGKAVSYVEMQEARGRTSPSMAAKRGLDYRIRQDAEPLAYQGDQCAQFIMGYLSPWQDGMSQYGETTQIPSEEGLKWFKLAGLGNNRTGQRGLPAAQFAVAWFYMNKEDKDEACAWMEAACEQNYLPAMAVMPALDRASTRYVLEAAPADKACSPPPSNDPRLSDDALEKLFANNDKSQASGAKRAKGSKKKRSKRSQQRRRDQQRRRQEKKAQAQAEASAKAEAWAALQKEAAAAAEAREKEAAHVAEVHAQAAAALRRDRRREQRRRRAQRRAQRRLELVLVRTAGSEAQRRELSKKVEPVPEPELAIALAVPVVVEAPAAPTPPPSMPPPGFDRDLEAAIKNSLLSADKEAKYPGHAAMAFRAEQTAAAAEPSSPTTFNPVPGAAARKNSRRRERRRQKKQLQRGLSRLADADGHECRICLFACTDAVVACRSGHVFCRGCIQAWMAQGGAAGQTCPTCRTGIRAASLVSCCCPCAEEKKVETVAQPPQPIGANRSSPTTGNAMCRQGLLSYASARLC